MPTLDTRPDGALVIEADTAAEALALVEDRLGSDAEIVAAEKVHRGGWKGFFAREQVQLVARPRTAAAAPAPAPAPVADAAPAPAPGVDAGGLDAALARMMQQEESRETTFQELLIRELAMAGGGADRAEPRVVEPAPDVATGAEAPPADATTPEGPARIPTGVAWSRDRLRELRLPDVVVDACDGLDPADDPAWVLAVAGAVSSWCRPLPTRDCVLVGPRAHRLAAGLGLDVARPGELVAEDRSVGVRVTDGPSGRGFVAEVRRERWLHLVAGGARWQGLLLDDVTAVSWVGDEALPAALEAAGRLGLVLGYGLGAATGKAPVRATPVDVALTIRSLLPRHA